MNVRHEKRRHTELCGCITRTEFACHVQATWEEVYKLPAPDRTIGGMLDPVAKERMPADAQVRWEVSTDHAARVTLARPGARPLPRAR